MIKKCVCCICGQQIPSARVEALKMLDMYEEERTCVKHSYEKPRQGVYLGEVGTSQLLIVDKVYDDSVRSVFKGAKKDANLKDNSEETEENQEGSMLGYDPKELDYYSSSDEVIPPEEKVEIIKRHQP